ncbi:delta(3,5)-Delta(2,4)-dienoyl-CoA isomerase, mitochondrial [Tribolium madens]|uniref:delta(3,5)-Delta(2,4)-dienoyl-CoA isomerase, mitochondrial n=1 Tax=Tribolium madens TaxID=41895 RepID=UPI001CF744A2|nr:delta(3,5)-Delta(2,4)-dienoyl-CoA isomerase, mitochondrial [Tribolium madens]XP_044257317.1 delta(3,5)-Delta(2,4)-dienoyl-CoA isomerase, mitochondrial [Tribolium madens]XP_044257323.1 delta(3,5)-Delta(2,4)-dienoyl-CoA isomerase, mitochondrial [Tribolium madens]XP_044257330.1 delta(3,5)-Delta(2,4)-dienoyl-CoA isomerase, mitochondrial [Tribolium madens]
MLSLIAKKANTAVLSQFTKGGNNFMNNVAKMSQQVSYETLSVTVPTEFVYHVELNRPNQLNAMNRTMWLEIGKCFENLNLDENCRAIVLSGAGKIFTAGLDFQDMLTLAPQLAEHEDVARKSKILYQFITTYQKSISWLELCKKPVLTAVHSACVGGGLDLITAADMRYCTKDAWFQVKEVDIGMAADVGTLQRLPKVIGSDSLVRELCYTARKMPATEALQSGLVSKVFEDKASMIEGVIGIAKEISKKSPVAVQGTKVSLVYSRDHTVQEGLDHIALWNQLMLQSEDFATATVAQATKQKDIVFSKL